MSKISKDEINERSKKRAHDIQQWISVHPECQKKGQLHPALVNSRPVNMKVYELPRYQLKLNPNNWRFKAEFDIIKKHRQKLGKSLELDSDNEDDKKTIRELLKGIYPKNEQRKERYNELKENFIANSENGSNGQTTPGIILYDGTYINGNRRDTILDDLSNNPPPGRQPTNFQNIQVVILSENVTPTDIKANETREQISLDSRERYDYTNSALMVADYMEHLIKIEKLSQKAAIKQIANPIFGLSEKNIQEYIDFKKIADNFLRTIGKPGQYSYIQDVGKDKEEGGIVQILKEIGDLQAKIKDFGMPATKTKNLIKAVYAYAWYSKEKPKERDNTGKLKPMNFNHRAFRNFKKEAFDSKESMNKLLESGTIEKINWKHSQDHALPFNADVTKAKNITLIGKSISQPIVNLESSALHLSRVIKDLNGPNEKEIKLEIQKNGLEYIKKIQSRISEISKKMDSHIRKK